MILFKASGILTLLNLKLKCKYPSLYSGWLRNYTPKNVYKERKRIKAERLRSRKVKRAIIAGGTMVVSFGLFGAGLIYKTIQELEVRLRFFHDVFETEQGYDSYIQVPNSSTEKDDNHDQAQGVWFPYLRSHSHKPKTLLQLAQSEERSIRHIGVHSLAGPHQWSDAQCRTLAQMLDERTLVGLARTKGTDHRLFLPSPRLPPEKIVLEDALRKLLSSLPTDNLDKCTVHFTSNALQEGSKAAAEERGGLWCFGGNGLAFTESLSPAPPEVVELFCLQALAKHSKVASHCPLIVKMGGLQIMRHIHEVHKNSIKLMRQIARILANMTLNSSLHDDIIKTGWVSILAQWIQSKDLALSLHATKALANLDKDYGESRVYEDGIYLYHPQFRYRESVYADIVFVHGLLGGPFRTWRQNDSTKPKKTKPGEKNVAPVPSVEASEGVVSKNVDKESQCGSTNNQPADKDLTEKQVQNKNWKQKLKHNYIRMITDANKTAWTTSGHFQPPNHNIPAYTYCWPKDWLAHDCPHVRILTVEYETHLSEWAPKCPYESEKRSIAVRSKAMLEKLKQAGIGDRPVIWVGHSMGGLIIKQMLLMARDDPETRHIVDRSRGIVMYSVPHRGSPLAASSTHNKYLLYPSVEVKELALNSQDLVSLHKHFTNLMFDTGIPLLSFMEGQKTELPFNLKVMIVPEESSDPGFGEVHVMEDMTHLDICKPTGHGHPLYQLTLDFIRDCIPTNLVEHILRANIPEEYIFQEDIDNDS